ncbi:carbohydrate ABC transporter permease [Mobilitalea sibirica]|uniref:Carbohydrate ABC transporter permease n=1 Tax=Mobilitalea sibirica TaxID=1462919 RepID=A0A8J7H7P8_9FIRM|nr:carbohydrate ABC transporter permease [Mobilitalea sibirica]MBH1939605.1 carbohydrate ABC transporter permease [Mobilitalea sibirica]
MIILILLSVLTVLPLWFVITGSFMGSGEFSGNFKTVLNDTTGKVSWPFLPLYPTLRSYIELLLDSPKFFIVFWNSCKQVFPSLLGQLLIAVPAAWSFARFHFKGKRIIFTIYIILMVMPFQVTMVSTYLVLDRIHLLDSHLAIIIPAIFSTFPVFIMVKFFKAIPRSLIEAARIDGAGEWKLFINIGIPMGAGGIISAMILDFLELYNAIEQPLNFIKTTSLWPLTLYLPGISVQKAGISLVASVVMLLPALLLFLYGQKYLEQGIMVTGIKE